MNFKDFILKDNSNIAYFPKGRYDFFSEDCVERFCYFSNNDDGMKKIIFNLENLNNFQFIGDNAEFVFHGRLSPIFATQCNDLLIKGISIDFVNTFVSDADIIEKNDEYVWLKISGKYWVENNRLRFTDDCYDNLSGNLFFYSYDIVNNELFSEIQTIQVQNKDIIEENGLIKIKNIFKDINCNNFVIKHEERLCPGLVIDKCKNVLIEDVDIFHCAGMGVLAQSSENIKLNNVNVVPKNRRISASDDAVHIVDCRGEIEILNCKLSATLDDSINVHGIYRPLKNRVIGTSFHYLDTGHFQQVGIVSAKVNDTLILLKNDTHIPYAQLTLKTVRALNKAMTLVEFVEDIPEEYTRGDCAYIKEIAEATLNIKNCELKSLLGRGILASGVAKAEITNNYFHTPGAGIFISGGADFWYETGPVKHAIIKNNIFDNCNHRKFCATREAISVFPELSKFPENFFYHGTIEILDNKFISNAEALISAQSVNSLCCKNNTLEQNFKYKYEFTKDLGYFFVGEINKHIKYQHCHTIQLDNNFL